MKIINGLASAFGAVSLLAAPVPDTMAAEQAPMACMPLMRIDHTHVIDDQNILFYARNGDIYLNRLSHRAIGLDGHRPFMYRTTVGRLCEHDIITVLEDHGFGFTPGASSTLGKFEPIDEARAEVLKAGEPASETLTPVE